MIRVLSVIKLNKAFYSAANNLPKSKRHFPNSNELSESQIKDLMAKVPALQKFSKEQWQKTTETLVNQGFPTSSLLKIIRNRPELLRRSPEKLIESLECWRDSQFGDQNVIELIEQHPEMLEYTDVIFSHSLDVIKCRHVFLTRLGLFKKKNPKIDPLEPSTNPKMHQIYDTSDLEFAVRTCAVTLEEFETFQEMYRRELDKGDNHDEQDD